MPANTFNFVAVFTVALGGFTYGFASTMIGSVLGLPAFWAHFGLTIDGSTAVVGATSGVFYGGAAIGGGLSSFLSNWLGRKRTLILTCALGVLGGLLQAAAVDIGMFLAGRTITGMCCGLFTCVCPVYQSEISPPKQRGRMVGAHGVVSVLGGSSATYIGLGCYFATNEQLQWRLILAFTILAPLVLLLAMPLLPESPRWLIEKGRYDQAREVLRRLHASPDDPLEILPKEEFIQIQRQIELEKEQKLSLRQALKLPGIRKRLAIGVLLPFFCMTTGQLVIANYQLGCGVCLILHTVMVALYAASANRVGCGFAVLFLFLFIGFYGGCLDVTGYVYWTEIFPMHARSAGVGVSIVSFFCTALLWTQIAPTAFATIGWKYFLVFLIAPVVGAPTVSFYMPETKGLSLEEIAKLFGEEVAFDLSDLTDEQKAALEKEIATTEDPVAKVHEMPMLLERVCIEGHAEDI
ncbi:hypothetical protein LTR93_011820 [Exophiala xenobiotica]|nr:hypothetical protein LTR93_011820 [Exophiala xenobiotica]